MDYFLFWLFVIACWTLIAILVGPFIGRCIGWGIGDE